MKLKYPVLNFDALFSVLRMAVLLCITIAAQAVASDKEVISLDELLKSVEKGQVKDASENRKRINAFRSAKKEQQVLFNELKKAEKKQETISESREQAFEDNDQEINTLHDRLEERLGALKELFGVLQQVSSDAQGQFYGSLTQLQYPERADSLSKFSEKMGQTTELPSIEEIERLWFELQREMTESGKILSREQAVVTPTGEEVQQQVIRVGAFNIVSEGKYLQFLPETGRVLEYSRQPAKRYMKGAEALSQGKQGLVGFTIDPTKGQLLGLLIAVPTLQERVAQGGVIGYVILCVGLVGVLIAVFRFIVLSVLKSRVTAQIRNPTKIGNNPLGRILDEYASHKNRDLETLELKMGEAVMREIPKITTGLAFLKIIAAIAPLMGLLGTVTGMIITFQSIVLFGAGDPKMMAGGISQALVTTVLGLVVAIPTLLLHSLLQTRAKGITEVLEQEAVAIVANQAERENEES